MMFKIHGHSHTNSNYDSGLPNRSNVNSNLVLSQMGAVGLNVTDTFYAKNSPIYLNLEN